MAGRQDAINTVTTCTNILKVVSFGFFFFSFHSLHALHVKRKRKRELEEKRLFDFVLTWYNFRHPLALFCATATSVSYLECVCVHTVALAPCFFLFLFAAVVCVGAWVCQTQFHLAGRQTHRGTQSRIVECSERWKWQMFRPNEFRIFEWRRHAACQWQRPRGWGTIATTVVCVRWWKWRRWLFR